MYNMIWNSRFRKKENRMDQQKGKIRENLEVIEKNEGMMEEEVRARWRRSSRRAKRVQQKSKESSAEEQRELDGGNNRKGAEKR